MNDLTDDEKQVLQEIQDKTDSPSYDKPTRVNNRNIVSIRIRGLAFKCATGSRRELVLLGLKQEDEGGDDGLLWGATGLVVGASIVGAIWFLI